MRDAVLSEPVSPPNSLLYGNLQGIFRNLGDLLRRTRSQGLEFPQLFRDIPYSKEQGIFSEWQGKYFSEQGDTNQYQGRNFLGETCVAVDSCAYSAREMLFVGR